MQTEFDVLVVGGGMAGLAAAAHVAAHLRVGVVEMEDQIGHHSTGRSAALYIKNYGNRTVHALTRASREFLYSPPASFTSNALVTPRPILVAARQGQAAKMESYLASYEADDVHRLSVDEAVACLPILRTDDMISAAISHVSADIDVNELHQGYARLLRTRGGQLFTGARVTGVQQASSGWEIMTSMGRLTAEILVNAAGAWAGQVAGLAGAPDPGIRPLKRTACLIDAPDGLDPDTWPLLYDLEDRFYLKPDAGKLMLSPADEALVEPHDAQADELDIAIAIDEAQKATHLDVRRVSHKWAGLRTFVADESPLIGYDPVVPNFFWVAALGGFGIQTAPGVGRLADALIRRAPLDDVLRDAGVDAAATALDRPALSPSGAG